MSPTGRPSKVRVIACGDVRRMQFAILARSPREMYQTDRIQPRYFLSRVRVSIRPRIFLYAAEKSRTSRPLTDRPGSMLQRHRPSERRNLKGSLYLHARWRHTSQFTQNVRVGYGLWMVLLAPRQNHPRLRESYPLCKDPAKHGSDPAKRGSVCEAFQ